MDTESTQNLDHAQPYRFRSTGNANSSNEEDTGTGQFVAHSGVGFCIVSSRSLGNNERTVRILPMKENIGRIAERVTIGHFV
jgi:hypothetical protein